jgi:hypothetical protein
MKGVRTLARLTDVATERAFPLFGKVFDAAKKRAERLSHRMLGDDFEERVAWLRRRYDAMGGDPFGLDPDVAKSVVTVLSFFHRMYFRTHTY